LIEETYEATEAIEKDDWNALAEELGDVLLQPVFHMRLAERDNEFEFNEPLKRITDKLVRRHPHVFATTEVNGSDEVLKNWDAIKKQEKKLETSDAVSILSGVPTSLPALLRAMEISKRAARAGFEWPDIEGVKDKVLEELNEFEQALSQQEKEAEFGDLLFTLVNFARWQKIDAEAALRQMVLRFQKRFEQMELSSSKPLNGLSPEEWDQLWSEAKNKSQNES
jgi:MazG family protein